MCQLLFHTNCECSFCEGSTKYWNCKGKEKGNALSWKKSWDTSCLGKELYTVAAGLCGWYGLEKKFFDGSVRWHFVCPSWQNMCDPNPEKGWRRKSGAAETLISHAGKRYDNLVRQFWIQLRQVSIRAAWLTRRPRFSIFGRLKQRSLNAKHGRRHSQTMRKPTSRSWIQKCRTESRILKMSALNKTEFCEVAPRFLVVRIAPILSAGTVYMAAHSPFKNLFLQTHINYPIRLQ